jgi:hypothetical protein
MVPNYSSVESAIKKIHELGKWFLLKK